MTDAASDAMSDEQAERNYRTWCNQYLSDLFTFLTAKRHVGMRLTQTIESGNVFHRRHMGRRRTPLLLVEPESKLRNLRRGHTQQWAQLLIWIREGECSGHWNKFFPLAPAEIRSAYANAPRQSTVDTTGILKRFARQ